MDKNRKKQLMEAWKLRHPQMCVIAVRCIETGETFLGPSTDIPAMGNRIRFQLGGGNHPNGELQQLWNRHGSDAFAFTCAAELEYDDPADDHTAEFEELYEACLAEDATARRLWK